MKEGGKTAGDRDMAGEKHGSERKKWRPTGGKVKDSQEREGVKSNFLLILARLCLAIVLSFKLL